uniref:Uncharacterized protein n=1 Tax=Chromera velia CCMP2878 TaxID=1169474 RepID=A0A0G4F5M1_9ALVE|mmetsp:Transcript_1141/g.2395  ORF Transcript_1141/g.2395 Transcript_1141/m.2395 type:complete len:193 (+) Transcript_1141:2318-2896(+)|eukprot:Cvel_15228.t1-p1 / transcript=Cvel_15228.t1 / gene=Cvel_15228 / organism=Chromera_velia_CCMP2878 / gene_product=hypothetical protein / transcript_product=hypothetical protein / location=Cvel_scaffold1114:32691-33266(+) / protein_length=192 / sequence_SO=supercontig / SO=protein_coding / is_pseudo=false
MSVEAGKQYKKLRERLAKNIEHLRKILKEGGEDEIEEKKEEDETQKEILFIESEENEENEERGREGGVEGEDVKGVTQTAHALTPLVNSFCKKEQKLSAKGAVDCGCRKGENCHVAYMVALDEFFKGRKYAMKFCPIKNAQGKMVYKKVHMNGRDSKKFSDDFEMIMEILHFLAQCRLHRAVETFIEVVGIA